MSLNANRFPRSARSQTALNEAQTPTVTCIWAGAPVETLRDTPRQGEMGRSPGRPKQHCATRPAAGADASLTASKQDEGRHDAAATSAPITGKQGGGTGFEQR
jgi:hypothetical protein